MNEIDLLKNLIAIPSFVEGKINESSLGRYIYDYLKNIPNLEVKKQFIDKNRFNIIATDNKPTKLLLYGHLDTVTPRSHSVRDQLKPTIVGDKLYGLGAVDMKAGLAAILSAVVDFKETNGLAILFSCDEEYEFLGTKKFLSEFKLSPKLLLGAEATDLMISNGCRGVLEVTFKVEGKTAHASIPSLGVNAIEGTIKLVNSLKKPLKEFSNKELGMTTINLSYLNGGLVASKDDNKIVAQANSVPDIALAQLELRITNKSLTPERFKKLLEQNSQKLGLKISDFKVHFCVNPYTTSKKSLEFLEEAIKKAGIEASYLDSSQVGYYDTQLLQEAWKVPTASFGPGPRTSAHKSNEYVSLESFYSACRIYKKIIADFCTSK